MLIQTRHRPDWQALSTDAVVDSWDLEFKIVKWFLGSLPNIVISLVKPLRAR
jgi:hypothetical protein